MTDQAAALRALVSSESPAELRNTRVYAVASGKGGVGKSTVVANLGVYFAREGLRTIILDGDLGLANIDILLNLHPTYTVNHVLRGQKTLEEIIVEGPCGVMVVPGASGLTSLVNLDPETRKRLLVQLARVGAAADVLIIDAPAGIGSDVIGLATAAQAVIVVATPEPTSLTDAYALIKVIWQQSATSTFGLLINQAPNEDAARAAAAQITSVAKRFLRVEIKNLGHLPDDPNVSKAVRRQEALLIAFPNSPAAKGIEALAERLLNDETSPEPQSGILRLVRRFARGRDTAAAS